MAAVDPAPGLHLTGLTPRGMAYVMPNEQLGLPGQGLSLVMHPRDWESLAPVVQAAVRERFDRPVEDRRALMAWVLDHLPDDFWLGEQRAG